ncbi:MULTISPECIES: GerMN domain-containing protein [Paenibacillus]|uniref:GerMN domain-containing protein n=1 Tax=Paenibacillus TaxID=44249 RepID=UPI002FE3812C
MNTKRWTQLGMIVLLLAWSTGCGQKPQAAPDEKPGTETRQAALNEAPQDASESPEQPVEPPKVNSSGQAQADSAEKQRIEAYYTDDQMLELKTVTAEITYKKEQDKYLAALQTLKSSGQSDMFALWEKAEFRSANLKDGVLTVDIHLPDEARLGAGGEALALEALKRTVFQFKEIEAVDLLVDGDPVETLMGHEELEHPIPRN